MWIMTDRGWQPIAQNYELSYADEKNNGWPARTPFTQHKPRPEQEDFPCINWSVPKDYDEGMRYIALLMIGH